MQQKDPGECGVLKVKSRNVKEEEVTIGSELLMGSDYLILGQRVNKCPQIPVLVTVVFLVMSQLFHQGRSYRSSIVSLSGKMDLNLVP